MVSGNHGFEKNYSFIVVMDAAPGNNPVPGDLEAIWMKPL
jgi:hypothetical protein